MTLSPFYRAAITREIPADTPDLHIPPLEEVLQDPYYLDLMDQSGLTPPGYALALQFHDPQEQDAQASLPEVPESTSSETVPIPSEPEQTAPSVQLPIEYAGPKITTLHEHPTESRHTFYVTGEEALIVKRANQLEIDMKQRAQNRCPPGLVPAIYMPETPMEHEILNQREKLEEKIQRTYNLDCKPLLIDQVEPVQGSDQPGDRKRPPTELEMANEIIKRIPIRRKGPMLYLYNAGVYELLDDNSLQALVLSTIEDLIKISGSSRLLEAIPKFLRANDEISCERLLQPDNKVCLEDGVLNIDTLSLEPFSPYQFLTWRMAVKWQEDSGCPNFNRYLHQITGGDPLLIQIFWEALAYILFCPDNRGKKFIYMYGVPNSGKSVFGRLIQDFYPKDFVSSVSMESLGERFTLGSLLNKKVNLCMDLSDSVLNEKAVSVLKRITGMDTCDCEVKYHSSFPVLLDVKLIFASNFRLRIASNDIALYKRVLLLPFPFAVSPHDQIPNLDKLLVSEKSGILHQALPFYRQLRLNNFRFTQPPTDMYNLQPSGLALESNGVEEFMAARIIAEEDGFVPSDMLYNVYLDFCNQHGFVSLRDAQTLSSQLKPLLKLNFQSENKKKRVDHTPKNGYTNIGILPADA